MDGLDMTYAASVRKSCLTVCLWITAAAVRAGQGL